MYVHHVGTKHIHTYEYTTMHGKGHNLLLARPDILVTLTASLLSSLAIHRYATSNRHTDHNTETCCWVERVRKIFFLDFLD